MTRPSPVVELRGATRRLGRDRRAAPVLDRVSLAVHAGEVVGVSGPSGAGKSTLLRTIAGLERPDEGELVLAGAPAWPERGRRRLVGRRAPTRRLAAAPRPGFVMPVFQDPFASLDPRWPLWRSVSEPVLADGAGRRSGEAVRRAQAATWLARVGLGDVPPDARPHELSGGQCQRVAIVRALAARPALVTADEPSARQDPVTAAALAELLRLVADDGAALVVVSHDTSWLARFVDRHLRLHDGALEPG